jgi:hypothetical protein
MKYLLVFVKQDIINNHVINNWQIIGEFDFVTAEILLASYRISADASVKGKYLLFPCGVYDIS